MDEILTAIAALPPHSIVAVDGRCGGGKTTLAAAIAAEFDCNVIHMDDFFLRPEQRTPQRLATAGENIDHERFLTEVLQPLKEGKVVHYRPFDCSQMALGAPISVPSLALTVVEGSYCLHPQLFPYYDLCIFVDIDSEEQMRRIVKRNNLSAETFRTRWIPMEENYFSAFSVKEKCDIIYHTNKKDA